MESSGGSSPEVHRSSRRFGVRFSPANFIQAPLSALIEYSGIFRGRSVHHEAEPLVSEGVTGVDGLVSGFRERLEEAAARGSGAEVSIRIIGVGEQEHVRVSSASADGAGVRTAEPGRLSSGDVQGVAPGGGAGIGETALPPSPLAADGGPGSPDGGAEGESASGSPAVGTTNGRETSYQRYDIQQLARWIEQILPFTLLLLVVFIRQHLQVMIKSNDVLRKQTALKGERKVPVLVGIILISILHAVGVYWWFRNDDLLYPLVMLPPKSIPPFWHAIFIIVVNDTMVRQAAIIFKCVLLIYYKNSRGRNYRKQGQMLTLVEYFLLLYRALLPTPVWYRFFLNKDYGSLFSSLTTGLYLTFKLTSIVEKALSRKEVHYGSYATPEQVNAAGDLCAICQEKMHAPILLRCKHIFCEDCVSEWFERERTCPLCRALVKPAELKSFGDGSTSLAFEEDDNRSSVLKV
ncbi:RING finger and transmembrane domain-containing protein 2 [Nymphaea thermarum]|nr:RING finger and transmembrane domain-containing protein 2 [Nymphaea thermarum]